MAPSLLFDISSLDLDSVAYDTTEIEKTNPHRGEMRLLDKIVYYDPDPNQESALAYLDIRPDAFWTAGHIPGRPIFPGVMVVEAAAQLSSFVCLKRMEGDQTFMGFAGADKIKFRGQVAPGDRLWILCQQQEFRRRRCICKTQALVNGTLVYEGTITGMPM